MRRQLKIMGLAAVLLAATAAQTLADVVDGTSADDVLTGTAGADTIHGFAGNDTLLGRAGRDLLDGGPGRDRIYAGRGADEVLGRRGADTIYSRGDEKQDILRGGPGPDTFYARGPDRIFAGDGNDTVIMVDYAWLMRINCGPGIDTVIWGANSPVFDPMAKDCEHYEW